MSLTEIINSGANITLQVSADQLGQFANDLIGKAKMELAREIEENSKEVYYTREQAATILSVTLPTLWNWDKKGFLKPVRFGGLCRYKKSDIERLLTRK